MAATEERRLPCIGLLLCALAAGAADSADSPEQVIAAAAAAFATVAAERRDELEQDLHGSYALVDEYLIALFDLDAACALILRGHWTSARPAERRRFVSALYRSLLATHGRALLSFRHDTISVQPAAAAAAGSSARVRATLRLSNGSVYDLEFYMRHGVRGWRIVDIIAEGVSYVRTFRTDFGAEIRATSFDALTQRLETLAADGG